MRFKGHILTFIAIITLLAAILISCAGKRQKAVQDLSEALRSEYTSDISFTVSTDSGEYAGKATITRNGYITRIDIHSPDPYEGLSVEYNIKGLPDSVAMHFSGMSAELPMQSISRISPLTSLFADDFASVLSKLPAENIKEYELEDGKGICASILYNGADITLYFSPNGTTPHSLEFASDTINAHLTFDSFSPVTLEFD